MGVGIAIEQVAAVSPQASVSVEVEDRGPVAAAATFEMKGPSSDIE